MLYTIYKIECNEPNEFVYIGSTINFTTRKCQHKSHCKNVNCKEYNYNVYCKIRESNDWSNWTMSPIEQLDCDTKLQSRIREQHWIDDAKSRGKIILNLISAQSDITPKQYRMDHKEESKKYRMDHKEEAKQYRMDHKEDQKQYYINNKDRINENKKQYRIKRKIESAESINNIIV